MRTVSRASPADWPPNWSPACRRRSPTSPWRTPARSPTALRRLPPGIRYAYVESFAKRPASDLIFLDVAPLLLAAFVLSWSLKEKPLATSCHASQRSAPSTEAVAAVDAGPAA